MSNNVERNRKIFQLALSGMTYRELGEIYNITDVTVWCIVKKIAIERWGEEYKDKIHKIRRGIPNIVTCSGCKEKYRSDVDIFFVRRYGKCVHCHEERYAEILQNKLDSISI